MQFDFEKCQAILSSNSTSPCKRICWLLSAESPFWRLHSRYFFVITNFNFSDFLIVLIRQTMPKHLDWKQSELKQSDTAKESTLFCSESYDNSPNLSVKLRVVTTFRRDFEFAVMACPRKDMTPEQHGFGFKISLE